MSAIKCPVCGKTGIPDYTNKEVICPNCNSNLGIYHTLHSIAEDNDISNSAASKFKKVSIALSIALLTVLLGGIIAFLSFHESNKKHLLDEQNKVTELSDSIRILSAQVRSIQIAENAPKEQFIEYTILPNDSPWRIVHKFYGLRKDWESISKEIANKNGLWNEESNTWKPIYTGQIIKIYSIK